MQSHPFSLKKLLTFKKNNEFDKLDKVLPFCLYLRLSYTYDELDTIFFDYVTTVLDKNQRIEIIKNVLDETMEWRFYRFEDTEKYVKTKRTLYHRNLNKRNNGGLWFLECKDTFIVEEAFLFDVRKKRKNILEEYKLKYEKYKKLDNLETENVQVALYSSINTDCKNNTEIEESFIKIESQNIIDNCENIDNENALNNSMKENKDLEKIILSEDQKKKPLNNSKSTSQIIKNKQTLLLFAKKENKKESVNTGKNGRFTPLVFDKNVIVYKRNDLQFQGEFTLRKPKDIENPRKLTFIKFHDSIRPPFYGFKDKINCRNSLHKLSDSMDYEFDSEVEWEDTEDADDIGSTDEEEEEDSYSNNDWIDSNSESEDEGFTGKKPYLVFPNSIFLKFREFDQDFLKIPLFEFSKFPDELISVLKEFLGNETLIREIDLLKYAKIFSEKNYIKYQVVIKKIKDLFPEKFQNDSLDLKS